MSAPASAPPPLDWSLISSLAARNLLRNVRRTVITAGAVVAGVAVLIAGWGLVDGLDENVLRAQEGALSGHLVVQPSDWPEDGLSTPVEDAEPLPDALVAQLRADPRVQGLTTRTWFDGRAVSGIDGMRVRGFAYDPDTQAQVFDVDRWQLDGDWPTAPGQVVVGQWLAHLLELSPGSELVVEARTVTGAFNALPMTVSGVIHTGTPTADRVLWVPAPLAQDLLRYDGAVSHLAVRLQRRGQADAVADSVTTPGWTAHTATWLSRDILAINAFRRRAISVVVGILMLIAGTGIANTVIMAAYERVREVGTLRAMGMSPAGIRALFLVEGAVMGASAGLVGTAIGCAVVLWFSTHGIDLSTVADEVGELAMASTLYMRFSWPPVVVALVFGLLVSVVASIYPANHAARLDPAEAVRAD
ncbi:MAG: ABC transporter permease [Alphaproteobacteria bacterium]|nr:ABC transporter permease [Alphaproteobacteria bacterium]